MSNLKLKTVKKESIQKFIRETNFESDNQVVQSTRNYTFIEGLLQASGCMVFGVSVWIADENDEICLL